MNPLEQEPGNYDAELTAVLKQTGGVGGVLIIVGGERGQGFAIQVPRVIAHFMPSILRHVADEIADGLTKEQTQALANGDLPPPAAKLDLPTAADDDTVRS